MFRLVRLCLFLGLVFGCPQASAVVAVHDTGSEVFKAASTTFSSSALVNVTAGSSALVCTVVFGFSGTNAPTGVAATWNGVSMTKVTSLNAVAGVGAVYIFGLRSPATGSNVFSLGTWTNSAEVMVYCVSFGGVDTTSDLTAFPHQATQDVGVSNRITITSATGNLVVAAESPMIGAYTLDPTILYDDHANGSFINAGSNYASGAASVSIGMSTANNAILIGAIDIGAGAGGGGITCSGGMLTRGAGVC
jgi:hypothetical protein